MDDNVLILQFLENASERAFEELVRQHAGLVYSVALRKTGNHHQAEDITQQVFSILAQKAGSVSKHRSLAAWLHRVSIYCAGKYIRDQAHRRQREQNIAFMDPSHNNEDWDRLAPILDEEMDRLPELDRHALLLRFFEKKGIREIGDTLGISEEAAKKRVVRALEKLRNLFMKRGIPIGTAGLSMVLEQKTTAAISFEFQLAVSKFAIKTAAAKGGLSLSSLTQLLIMNTIKYKIATVAILACLLTGAIWHVIKDERFHSIGKEATTLSSKDVKKNAVPVRYGSRAQAEASAPELSPAELAQCVKNLKKALNAYDKNARTRSYPPNEVCEAIWHLGRHHREVFDALVEASKSSDSEVRKRAISSFGELRNSPMTEEIRKFLWPLLRSSDMETASAALMPLQNLRFQPSDIPDLASILSTTTNAFLIRYIPEGIAKTMAANGDNATPYRAAVEPLLNHSNDSIRVAAACALLQPGVTPDVKIMNELIAGLGSGGDWQAGMRNLMVIENALKLGTNGMALAAKVLDYANTADNELMRKKAFETAAILNPDLIAQNAQVAEASNNARESQDLRAKMQYSTHTFDDLLVALKKDPIDAAIAAERLGEMGVAAKDAVPQMIEALDGKPATEKDKIFEQILKIDPTAKIKKVSTLDLLTSIMDTTMAVGNRPESDDNMKVIKLLEGMRRSNNQGKWKTVPEINRLLQTVEQADVEASRLLKNTLLRKSPDLGALLKLKGE